MIKPEEVQQTVKNLNTAYPNGWRSGIKTCDAITVILANGVRVMTEALFRVSK